MDIKKYTLLIIPVILFSIRVFASYIITPFNYEWCSATFPTNYVSANFSITETYIAGSYGFTKNQLNKTLIISIPAGLEFKISGTTASVTVNIISSPEVIIDSFKFNSVNQLTVWITTSPNNADYNTISFNNFEIRAISAGTNLKLIRPASPNGGDFKIDNTVARPLTSQPFGTFSAKEPYVYSSSAVTQLLTATTINQFSINNPILRIRITGTGNCGSNITQFNFSAAGTNGTDSLRNISKIKVYYSTSSSFNYTTASLFGSVNNPSTMSFSVKGYYNTTAPTIYFYLCYDVPGDAYTDDDGNRLDASLTSFVLDGNTIVNMATPSPAGYRRVVPSAFYYSNNSGNWTDNIWSVSEGGLLCNCQPNGAGVVYIDTGDFVSVDKSRKVDVLNIMKDASLQGGNANMKFYITTEMNIYDNGFSTFLGDIIVKGNVNIFGTGTSWFHKVDSIGGNLYIGPGATLMNFASSTNDLALCGDLTVYGILQNDQANINLFNNSTIDGTGTIRTNSIRIKDGDKTIKSTANLNFDADIMIEGSYVVDNFGIINIRGNMDADSNTSHWINEPNSVLSYGGSTTMFSTKGYLAANSEYNTVRYSGLSDQIIIGPDYLTYYNLVIEGSGTKSLQTDIHLHGDFTFDAAFSHVQKTITIDGTVMQYFSGSMTPTLYNLTMNNSAQGLTLHIPVSYANNLNLVSGKIFTTMTNLLIAKDNAKANSGSDISFVNGPMQKIGNDEFIYPIGKDNVWARIGISAPQTTAAAFTAEYFFQKYANTMVTPPLQYVSEIEYWNLLQSAKAGDSIKVKLYWENGIRSGIYNYSQDLVVAGFSGTTWTDKGQSAITGSNPGNITSFFVKSFGPFTFGSKYNMNPLPISLSNFNAKCIGDIITITWTTLTETNNDYFTVEKSLDATNFETMAIVKGAGNSNELIYYSIDDSSPFTGISYYRLKQTDYDGKYAYSKIVAVDFNKSHEFTIYPNPFNTVLNIDVNEEPPSSQTAEFFIYNTMGRQVMHTTIIKEINTLETRNIASGIYFYTLILDGKTAQSGKLISQH